MAHELTLFSPLSETCMKGISVSDVTISMAKVNGRRNMQLGLYLLLVTVCESLVLIGLILQPERGFVNWFTALGALLAVFAIFFAIKLFALYRGSYSKLFIIIGYPLLLSYCFFLLPTNVPDENAHIRRIFDLFPSGDVAYAPRQVNEALDEHWFTLYSIMYQHITEPANYEIWTASTRYAGYSWFVYFVPYVIARIGMLLDANPWISIYLARFFNMTVYLIACYWILKHVPLGSAFLFVFMMNPIMLQQQASCSADSLTNTSMLLFVAQLLMMRFKQARLLWADWIKLALALLLIALCKLSNLPLALLGLILLPRIQNVRIRRGVIVAVPLFAALSVFLVVSAGYADALQDVAACFNRPLDFFVTLGITLLKATPILAMQYFGGQLGWPELNERPGEYYVGGVWVVTALIMTISLLACRYNQGAEKKMMSKQSDEEEGVASFFFKSYERLILFITGILLFFISYIALSHGLYHYDTGLGYISWMQGRHFLSTGLVLGFWIIASLYRKPKTNKDTPTLIGSDKGISIIRIASKPYLYSTVSGLIALYTIIMIALDTAF